MAEIANIFLSPFLEAFFEKMASGEFVDFFRRRKLSDGLLKKLKTTFLTFTAVLEDAEELEVTKPAVKEWLDELKDVVYDAENVLDEIATEALRSELDAQFQTTASKVRKLSISAFRNSFVQQIEPKIKEILGRLESLAQQKDLIGLREGVGGKLSKRLPTTSLVEESNICGRDDDKEAIIKMLLSDGARGNEMGVIAIVGMGGIGKTTLAQFVYNDNRVKEHFNNLEAWVCVSEEFDVFKVTKTILEAITSSTCNSKDLNQLQLRLKECLTGKKFLIVLDDVWNKNYAIWEDLSKPFKYGKQGSKVIVTTRDNGVALVMRASSTHHLKKLSEEDCWSLFTKHAFHDGIPNAHPQLEELGRQIVEKCDGLPLAIKTIGALLRSKLDVDDWDKILKSELWDLPIDETKILPALRLSFKHLPSHLKRCFAYCSIFPKGYFFEKDQLVLLWMAEGFLHEFKNKTIEEVGDEYFFALVSRSLFQQSSDDKSLFIMHDLVNDLATFVSGKFTVRMEGDYSKEIVDKVRHLSYVQEEFVGFKKFKPLYKAKKLCTFLPIDYSECYDLPYLTKKVSHELLPMLTCLRVLSLSMYTNMSELPDSIGKLKHLRYLDLSSTGVRRLPDSICQLCNLQTLILSKCRELAALPRDMWKLINLRHLDITETGIKEMPIHLGRLKCLQTLTKFNVSKGSGSCIGELGNFTNLRGLLSISELQNVESPTDALNANLRDKKYLEELELEWKYHNNFSESQRSVLDSLQAHTNLQSLAIIHYSGTSFSEWVGHPSFSKITSLHLQICKCSSFPPLGQLHSLQNLCIVGFDEVVTVSREFCGSGSSSFKPFGALKVLKFEDMWQWEEWICFGEENGVIAFPQLEELYISNCPKLTRGLPVHLPSLAILDIHACPQLVAPLPRTPAICNLRLHDCNEVLLNELPTKMQKLEIEEFHALESLPEGMIDSNSGLQVLNIDSCSSLVSLPEGMIDSNSGLQVLNIDSCSSLVSLPEGMIKSYNNLQKLVITNCYSLVSLPKDGLPTTLKTLKICCCMILELPPYLDYSSLEKLLLHSCSSLKSFPLDLFPKLYRIEISDCINLESLTVPENYEHDLVTLEIGITSCPKFVCFPKGGLRAPSLTSFGVWDCGNLRSLPDKMHILVRSLEELKIIDCPEVNSFPEGGLPSNQKSIVIDGCDKLVASRMGWGLQNLPFLRSMSIGGKSEDVESFPEAQLLPPSLTSLSIHGFPNLKSLDKKGIQHLRALERLCISDCPKLKYMPEQVLPASLSILKIIRCPLLKKEWQSKKGKEWRKIAHVEQKWIDCKLIE